MKLRMSSHFMDEALDPMGEREAKSLPPTPHSLSYEVPIGGNHISSFAPLPTPLVWRSRYLPLVIFLVLCVNLALAPAVYAANGGAIARGAAYAIGLLGLVILGLAVYLFVVVFQPERF